MSVRRKKTLEFLQRASMVEPTFYTEHVPIVWKRAYGTTIEDVDGNKYIDFTSSMLVANIGHTRQEYSKEIKEQAEELLTCYNFPNVWRILFAEELIRLLPHNLGKVYLMTTGTEAVEAAIKIAKAYTQKNEFFSFQMSFHGRTLMTISLGGKRSRKEGFGPFVSGIIHAPYAYCYRCVFGLTYPSCKLRCVEYLDTLYDTESSGNVAGLLIEPYLGAGGTVVPPPDYLASIEEFCRKRDILLILDEIQSGFGRTGKMFAFEHSGIKPNLLCLGKGITCGIPGSAVVGEPEIMDSVKSGAMSTTYSGNPLVGRVGHKVLDIIKRENLVENARKIGEKILTRLLEFKEKFSFVGDTRGLGLVDGIEIVKSEEGKEPAPDVAKQIIYECFKRGLLLIGPDGFYSNVVVLGPPLIINEEETEKALQIIEDVLEEIKNA